MSPLPLKTIRSPRDTVIPVSVQGWVAFVEECVIRWIDTRPFDRDTLQDLLAKSLPAVALASTDEEVGTLVSILTAERAINAG